MITNGKTLTSNGAYVNGHLYNLTLEGTGSISTIHSLWLTSGGKFTSNGMNLIIAGGEVFVVYIYGVQGFNGSGTISSSGSGALVLVTTDGDVWDIDSFTITCEVDIESGGTGRNSTLSGNVLFQGNVVFNVGVDSSLHMDSYTLSAVNFNIISGTLYGENGNLNISGNWDSHLGSFVRGSSLVTLSGSGKDITMNVSDACTGGFNNLTISPGASYTLQNNAYYWGTYTNNGSVTLNGYTMTLCSAGIVVTSYANKVYF
jgi:hypothetical protein